MTGFAQKGKRKETKMSSFRIVGKKQEVDPCYGLYDLYIDRDDIEALLSGKKLYSTISFDEYAITIEMENEDGQ